MKENIKDAIEKFNLDYIKENVNSITSEEIDYMIKKGFSDGISFVLENSNSLSRVEICKFSFLNGQLCLSKSLDEQDDDCITHAAKNGYLELLKYYYNEDDRWNDFIWSQIIDLAALNGHLNVLKWIYENGRDLNNGYICSYAARNGYLTLLKWLREIGCEFTCACAAENGHLEVLIWLHENGCHWDKYTCERAAENGHLECLKYAYENGCEWNSFTCTSAARNRHL